MATAGLTVSITGQATPEQIAAMFGGVPVRLADGAMVGEPSAKHPADQQLAEGKKTKKVDGVDLPSSAFLIVGDTENPETWNLPVHFPSEEQSKSHVQNAMARVNQVQGASAEQKSSAARKLAGLARKYGIKVNEFKKQLTEVLGETDFKAHFADVCDPEHEPGEVKDQPPQPDGDKQNVVHAANKPERHMAWLLTESLLSDINRRTHTSPIGTLECYEIPVAITGSWVKGGKRFSITNDDLDEIVANFSTRENGMIPLDWEHASETPEIARGGPVPAAGFIHKLTKGEVLNPFTGKKVPGLTALVEFEPEAKSMVASGKYRFFSPAIDWGKVNKATGKPQGATMTSGALTNHPFLEHLPPIMLTDMEPVVQAMTATDPEAVHVDQASKKVSVGYSDTPNKKEATMASKKVKFRKQADGKVGIFDDQDKQIGMADEVQTKLFEKMAESPDGHDVELSEETLDRLHQSQGNKGPSTIMTDVTPKKSRAELLSECVTADGTFDTDRVMSLVSERAVEMKALTEVGEIQTAVAALATDGKILPRHKAQFARRALSDRADFNDFVATAKPIIDLKTLGIGGDERAGGFADPKTELERRKAQKLAEHKGEEGYGVAEAYTEIAKEDPKLWDDYSKTVLVARDKSGAGGAR